MANRNQRQHDDHAETEVVPSHLVPSHQDALADAAAETHGRYREYLRSLEELPMLVDVVREPPRTTIKDFRLGQRPDARKAPREDVTALRAQHARDVARQYEEYVATLAELSTRKPPRKAVRKAPRKKRTTRAKRAVNPET